MLKAISLALSCFVFGVHHFGKDQDAGARGTIAFEDASDVILACLGERTLSGTIKNTRLALRKNKAGQQGEVHPFTLRLVEAPEPDDDGQPITSMVVDWKAAAGTPNAAGPAPDPWAGARRQDQRTAALRLKKVLMSALAEQGVDREIDGTTMRGRSGDDTHAFLPADTGGRFASREGQGSASAVQARAGLGRDREADRLLRDQRRRLPVPLPSSPA